MHIASSSLPRIASRQTKNAYVLVFARGNATSTANTWKAPLTAGGNFGTFLNEKTSKFEHKDLLVIPGEDVRNTYVEVQKQVDSLACGLSELWVRAGETYVSALPDNSQNLFLALTSARAGITFVPFSPNAKISTVLDAVKQRKAKILAVPDSYANRDYIKELYSAIPELDSQRRDMLAPFNPLKYPSLKTVVSWSKDGKEYHGFQDYKDFETKTTPFRNPLTKMASIPADQPALLLPQNDSLNFDSISHAALINTGHSILESLSVNIQDRISFAVPYNSLGYYLAAGSISHGTVLIQATKETFDANATLRSITRDKATILFISAQNIPALLIAAGKVKSDLSSLRTVVIVGRLDSNAAQEASKLGAKQVFGIDFVNGHTGQLTGLIQTAAGKSIALPGVEATIVDSQGKPVAAGTKGALRTKGPHVLSSTKASEGWVDTTIQAQAGANGAFSF